MYTIRFSNAFKKSYKRAISRGLDIGLLDEAVSILKRQGHLPDKYHPHPHLPQPFPACGSNLQR